MLANIFLLAYCKFSKATLVVTSMIYHRSNTSLQRNFGYDNLPPSVPLQLYTHLAQLKLHDYHSPPTG